MRRYFVVHPLLLLSLTLAVPCRSAVAQAPAADSVELRALTDSANRMSNRADSAYMQGTAASLHVALELKAHASELYHRLGLRSRESEMQGDRGIIYERLGQPDSALAYQRMALAGRKADGDRNGEGESLHNIGALFANQGRSDSALAYLKPAAQIRKNSASQGECRTLTSIGLAYRQLGMLDSALSYYGAALAIARQIQAPEDEGILFNNIGKVYGSLGRTDSALSYYQESLPHRRAAGDRRGEAVTLSNIGTTYWNLGVLDSAVAYLRAALVLRRATGDRRGEGVTLSSLANTFAAAHMLDSAVAYERLALSISRQVGNKTGEGLSLASIGLELGRMGQPDSALAYFRESLAIRREIRDREGEGYTLEDIAFAYRGTRRPGDLRLAVMYYDSAAAVLGLVTRRSGGESNRLSWADRAFLTLPDWTTAWLGRSDEIGAGTASLGALAVAERGRAQALLDLMRDSVAVFTPGTDFPAQGRRLASGVTGSGTAALVYLVTRDTLLIWVLRSDSAVEVVRVPVSYDTLAARIGAVRQTFSADGQSRRALRGGQLEADSAVSSLSPVARRGSWVSPATALADVLLPARVRELLAGARKVVVIPQWSLASVPFAALPAGSTGEPLGATMAIRYGPSLATVNEAESRPLLAIGPTRTSALRKALVVGNPVMPEVSATSGERGVLDALPGAEAESKEIAVRLGTSALTGSAATETAVRRRLSSASVIHLATHGFAYSTEAKARNSFVALAPDRLNDGQLTVGEILDDPTLKLTAELVVLSACQTGLGDLKQAEGTVGLQRAFLAKGARSVLVSLWNVSDVATRKLMTSFYGHWLSDRDHPDKAESLRRAQEDVRHTPGWEHPRFWAGFQLVGAR